MVRDPYSEKKTHKALNLLQATAWVIDMLVDPTSHKRFEEMIENHCKNLDENGRRLGGMNHFFPHWKEKDFQQTPELTALGIQVSPTDIYMSFEEDLSIRAYPFIMSENENDSQRIRQEKFDARREAEDRGNEILYMARTGNFDPFNPKHKGMMTW